MLAIIGGSGLSQLATLDVTARQATRTPYGEPSGVLTFGRVRGQPIVFLARHGYGHTIPPHEVNYRANLWALREAGVRQVISVASVGAIHADIRPGMLAVPNQIIDYTWGRPSTFFEGGDMPVTHVDFTWPYTERMRLALLDAGAACGERIFNGGVYAATQGPRLESAAEIERLARDGADLVGMTAMPEAALARELGLEYATLAVVANFAAGRGDSSLEIRLADVERILQEAMVRARRVVEEAVLLLSAAAGPAEALASASGMVET